MSLRRAARILAPLTFAFLASTLTVSAMADSYTSYITAQSDGNINNTGLTNSGTVVLLNTTTLTYSAFTPPATTVSGVSPSSFTFSNGSGCAPTSGTSGLTGISMGVCNGGFEVFEAYSGTSLTPDLYDGSGSVIYVGPVDNILLNAAGDVAFVGLNYHTSLNDQNILAIAQTPEPSSLVLLGTGLLGAVGVARRRFSGQVDTAR